MIKPIIIFIVVVFLAVSLTTLVEASYQYPTGFEEPCQVQQGTSSNFDVHIQTPDNETASDVVVTVPDPNIFTFTPKNISLGNLTQSAWEKVSFKVYAPETAKIDSYTIMYEIKCKDPAGTPHTIGLYAEIEVKPGSTLSSFYVPIIIVAVATVIIAAAIIQLKAPRKNTVVS